MIRIDEEVEPVIRIPIELQEQNLERYFTPEYPQRKKNSLTL